jgi:hypothetical protein
MSQPLNCGSIQFWVADLPDGSVCGVMAPDFTPQEELQRFIDKNIEAILSKVHNTDEELICFNLAGDVLDRPELVDAEIQRCSDESRKRTALRDRLGLSEH